MLSSTIYLSCVITRNDIRIPLTTVDFEMYNTNFTQFLLINCPF